MTDGRLRGGDEVMKMMGHVAKGINEWIDVEVGYSDAGSMAAGSALGKEVCMVMTTLIRTY